MLKKINVHQIKMGSQGLLLLMELKFLMMLIVKATKCNFSLTFYFLAATVLASEIKVKAFLKYNVGLRKLPKLCY